MIGTNLRVGQDIAFPRQTVFPHDTTYSGGNRGLMLRRRAAGRPYGVPGGRVVGEPELGDIADTIGGGSEVLGPDQEPGFPGGATPRATFIRPAPFPEAPPSAEVSDFDRALRLGGLTIGGAKQVAALARAAQPPGAEQPSTQDTTGGLADIADIGEVPGGGTQVPDVPEFDIAGDLESSLNQAPGSATQVGLGDLASNVPGGAVQVPEFDIAADLDSSFQGTPEGGVDAGGGFGLGDAAGALAAGVGITGAILSDRPIEQKAAISAVSAGQVAAPQIAGAVGGAAAAATASTVASGVGAALSLALLGESLANQSDNPTTAETREQNKAIASATASLISLGGALLVGGPAGGAVGAVLSIGLAIDSIARMLDAQNQGPPIGENWNDYKSILTGYVLEDKLPETFSKATNPLQLLGLALAGPALAPHGEVQISHSTWGSGGDYDTPVSPQLAENLSKIAATGDPGLLREFIRGVSIQTGATGSAQDNWLMTDTYRRTLVSLLPASHPVRQAAEAGTNDLFEPTPANYAATGGIEQFIESQHTGVGSYTTYQQPAMAIAEMIQRLQAGETPQYLKPAQYGTAEKPYRNWSPSPLFRQPGRARADPGAARALHRGLAVDAAAGGAVSGAERGG